MDKVNGFVIGEKKTEAFDISSMHREKDRFKPWYLYQTPYKIAYLKLDPNEEMIVVELAGTATGFDQREVVD